ncbi:hypothetical protein HY993_00400 [Candidatus Micrarchaeota archaeon]|nr:hypothetical protein [Candidatus Micrarchaeota archaeon]
MFDRDKLEKKIRPIRDASQTALVALEEVGLFDPGIDPSRSYYWYKTTPFGLPQKVYWGLLGVCFVIALISVK